MPRDRTSTALAIAAPGLSSLLADEFRELFITPIDVTDAGVEFAASPETIYRANLHSRIASRVILRLASFKAAHFSQLEQGTRDIEWATWLPHGATVAIRVTCRKSRLYHSGAVAERVVRIISDAVPSVVGGKVTDDEESGARAQLLLVRLDHDICTVSIDTSGELLHRRGYRQAIARAPLRETLAAAMLRAARWTGETPLCDPLCGSGTLPIEAALMARRITPGISRSFVFEQWPVVDRQGWDVMRADARAAERPNALVPIHGSDRDAGAIESAIANATRARVNGDIVFTRQALSLARPPQPDQHGLLIANPPWGERVGDAKALRDLYASFGSLARQAFAGWTPALLTSSEMLRRATTLTLDTAFTTSAGGIRVTLGVGPTIGLAPERQPPSTPGR